MLAGMLLIVSADSLLWLGVGAAVAGFGTSSFFRLIYRDLRGHLGRRRGNGRRHFLFCGTLGATSITWLIGYLSEQSGTLKAGMFLLLASVAGLLVLQVVLMLKKRRTAA